MNLVFPAPPSNPVRPPDAPTFTGIGGMRWDAWDGTSWDLLRGAGLFLSPGVGGLGMPRWDPFRSSSPAVAGARYRGGRALERDEILWPIFLYSDASSQEWVEWDRKFWRTMHPEHTGTWTVIHPDGQERSLELRFGDDGDHVFFTDPTRRGWELYAIRMVAERPLWRGRRIVRSWKQMQPVPVIGGGPGHTTGGLYISPGSTLGAATMDNPGDVDGYPVWYLTGAQSAELGVGDQVIKVPFEVPEHKVLVLDADPTELAAREVDAPVDPATAQPLRAGSEEWLAAIDAALPTATYRTRDLLDSDFAAIPPGRSVDLSLSAVGGATVVATLTPLYFRAW
ncbi:hypothetical protein [Thalassiella azotivora]